MSENPSQHVSPVTLEEVREQMRDCHLCRLCEGRNTVVFGDGNPHARVMFIGEGPGKNEDLGGRPFVVARKACRRKIAIELLARRADKRPRWIRCDNGGVERTDLSPHYQS